MAEVRLKVGDTLLADCIYKDANGNPVNLTTAGITIYSCVSSPDGLTKFPVAVTIKDQAVTPGGYKLVGDTGGWPIGELRWDIRYSSTAVPHFSTDSVTVRLSEGA